MALRSASSASSSLTSCPSSAMFNKLKTIFKGKEQEAAKTPPKAAKAAEPQSKSRPAEKSKAAEAAPATAKAKKKPASPEEACGITAKMSKEEVRERLALLYKRYNRATSSLDAGLRAEAEEMLDAVVAVREKIFGPI